MYQVMKSRYQGSQPFPVPPVKSRKEAEMIIRKVGVKNLYIVDLDAKKKKETKPKPPKALTKSPIVEEKKEEEKPAEKESKPKSSDKSARKSPAKKRTQEVQDS